MKMSLRPHCDSESGKKFICQGLYKKIMLRDPVFIKIWGLTALIFI